MRAAFYTFGCKLNQSESEALASSFRNQGFLIAPADQTADIIIINTCTVTSKSEQKARRIIRKYLLEQPEAVILVTGCYAQLRGDELQNLSEKLIILPHEQKDLLLDLPAVLSGKTGVGQVRKELARLRRKITVSAAGQESSKFRFKAAEYLFHTRPFLKIQDGCDNTCAYCTVPLARGRSVSQDREALVDQVMQLEAAGYREIVLTGVNISLYNSAGSDLADLLAHIIDASEKVRIRLSSLEPDGVSEKLCRVVSSPRICSHFHLPVQSGSKHILQSMKRRYRPEQVSKAAAMLKSVKGDPFIAGDVIVGFPGESDADFEATCSLIENSGFSRLHVFQFSSRPGTAAEGLNDKIPQRIAKERSRALMKLSDDLYRDYISRWNGKTGEALVEGDLYGITDNYLRVILRSDSEEKLKPGVLCRGRLSTAPGNQCILTVSQVLS